MQWTVIIPVKVLPHAKSRLAAASVDDAAHARLVTAMRRDTADAARQAAPVARVLVVADRGGEPTADLVQSAPGLNQAVSEAARFATQRWPADGIAALVGDLPALRSQELAAALGDAADHPSVFVADAAGTGTTLLTARPGVALRPAFGPESAALHARQAVAQVRQGPDGRVLVRIDLRVPAVRERRQLQQRRLERSAANQLAEELPTLVHGDGIGEVRDGRPRAQQPRRQ